MKVCTDACLFGGWVANDPVVVSAETILDIGTGTGLLSLMLAQANSNHSNLKITAIEIESDAANEAANNFALSPWANCLKVIPSSLQDYCLNINPSESTIQTFDCVITNPPFYEGDLKSPDEKKNLASHSAALPWSELIKHVSNLLKEGGSYFVLIPALRSYTMQKLAALNGLELIEEVLVHNTAKNLPIRAMQKFIKRVNTKDNNCIQQPDLNSIETNKANTIIKRSKIIIKDDDNKYTADFTALLKNYYLHL